MRLKPATGHFHFSVLLIVTGEWELLVTRLYNAVHIEHILTLLLALSCVFYYPDPVCCLMDSDVGEVGVTRIHSVLGCMWRSGWRILA